MGEFAGGIVGGLLAVVGFKVVGLVATAVRDHRRKRVVRAAVDAVKTVPVFRDENPTTAKQVVFLLKCGVAAETIDGLNRGRAMLLIHEIARRRSR